MAEELLLLSPAQIEAAAHVGRLARLAERLVEERSWSSLELLLTHAGQATVPIEELAAAARAVDRALGTLSEAKSKRPSIRAELGAVRALVAATLARRLQHDPLTQGEQVMVNLAAEIFLNAAQPRHAAPLFLRTGNDARAAEAFALLGDIENMEACHARIEGHRAARMEIRRIKNRVEADIASGQRLSALTLMQTLPASQLEETQLAAVFADLEKRIVRGRALVLGMPTDPTWVKRLAGVPAVLGRDPSSEITVRDPGVSRRHAVIVQDNGRLAIEDAASRAGTLLGGARVTGRMAIRKCVELTLGQHCRIQVVEQGPGLCEVRGLTGLERSLHVLVSDEPIDMGLLVPGVRGVTIHLDGGVPRIQREDRIPLRVAGNLIGTSCDLLHGDAIQLHPGDEGSPTVIIEVR